MPYFIAIRSQFAFSHSGAIGAFNIEGGVLWHRWSDRQTPKAVSLPCPTLIDSMGPPNRMKVQIQAYLPTGARLPLRI